MSCGIYKITNLINQKCYIGQSVDIERRWRQHKTAANNISSDCYNYPLQRAFRKYGIENFSFEILIECSVYELDEKEEFYINKFNSLSQFGYNQSRVEQGGTILTPENIEQIYLELQNNRDKNTDEIGQIFNVSGRTIRAINAGKSWHNEKYTYPIRPLYIGKQSKKGSQKNFCKKCKKEISYDSEYCLECFHIEQRIIERPSREELKQLIRNLPFTQIAKKYNVSDNAIRKWCKAENLPYKKSDINKISNENWKNI